MTLRTLVEICAKFLISRLKIGGAMAISLVAMTIAPYFYFLMKFLSSLRQEFHFTYFLVLMSTVSFHYVCVQRN